MEMGDPWVSQFERPCQVCSTNTRWRTALVMGPVGHCFICSDECKDGLKFCARLQGLI